MKFLSIGLMLAFLLTACQKDTCSRVYEGDDWIYEHSDYYTFIADDGGDELVLNFSIWWHPGQDGYEKEFKSLHGSVNPWSINYKKEYLQSSLCAIPSETWDFNSNHDFQFNRATREISSNITANTFVSIKIPERTMWTAVDLGDSSYVDLYAYKTTANINGQTRSGWMIYEEIRATQSLASVGDFKDFFWMPIVANNHLYFFEHHNNKQLACRWQDNGTNIIADTLAAFNFTILSTEADATSGRNNVPKTLQISAPTWNVDFTVASTGNHTGYGASFPNGLALYRQSLLETANSSVTQGYGMLELILEDD